MEPNTSLLDEMPRDAAASTALKLAQHALSAPIFNHSLRVYFLAKHIAEKEQSEWANPDFLPLIFVASICHDLGASDHYNGKQRFEVEGADAAKAHALSHGMSSEQAHQIWVAIAVHTSPGIAERIDPLSRLVRLAVKADFSRVFAAELGLTEYAAEVERSLPRLEVERALADAVVKQAVKIPDRVDSLTWPSSEKHPSASWPGILLRAHLENPDYEGVNPAF